MDFQKVKVIETKYNDSKNIVFWTIEFLENEKENIDLAIKGEDLGPMLGLNYILNAELIKHACKEFKNKEVNLKINSEIKDLPKIENMTDEQIQRTSRYLNNYPFGELKELEEMEKQ